MRLWQTFLSGIGIGFFSTIFLSLNSSFKSFGSARNSSTRIVGTASQENDFQYFIGSDELGAIAAHLFPRDKQYYYNYTAYDYYSVREIGRAEPLKYWKKFNLESLKHYAHSIGPSGLALVESIMVITGKHLKVRRNHMERVFSRQGIPISAIEYRWKWGKHNCANLSNARYIKFMLSYTFGDHTNDMSCATVMEHVDAWYSIAERNLSFALVIEDDVTFVPFLKEKFNRFISQAIKLQLISFDKDYSCFNFTPPGNISVHRLLKDPILAQGIFHFGDCPNLRRTGVDTDTLHELPNFTPYRNYSFGRCAHMYGMTHCAAKIMINVLQRFPPRYQWVDWLLNYVITHSSNLMGWWPHPPLGYQIEEMVVLRKLHPLLRTRTYGPPEAIAPI